MIRPGRQALVFFPPYSGHVRPAGTTTCLATLCSILPPSRLPRHPDNLPVNTNQVTERQTRNAALACLGVPAAARDGVAVVAMSAVLAERWLITGKQLVSEHYCK